MKSKTTPKYLLIATAASMIVLSQVTAEEDAAEGDFKIGVLTCASSPETQKSIDGERRLGA